MSTLLVAMVLWLPAGTGTLVAQSPLVYDCGKVAQGQVITHDWTFQNTGTRPLVLTVEVPGRKHAAVGFGRKMDPERKVNPGCHATLTAKIHTNTCYMTGVPGLLGRFTLHTSDPQQPVLQLEFRADVRRRLYLAYGSDFLEIAEFYQADKDYVRRLLFVAPEAPDLKLMVAVNDPAVQVKVARAGEAAFQEQLFRRPHVDPSNDPSLKDAMPHGVIVTVRVPPQPDGTHRQFQLRVTPSLPDFEKFAIPFTLIRQH